MALTFDQDDLPVCCGVGLVPGDPYTICRLCHSRFNTSELSAMVKRLRQGRRPDSQVASPPVLTPATPVVGFPVSAPPTLL